jgi:DNA polymerase I-like protein with 3'-5' exonuclease and polymerase domains
MVRPPVIFAETEKEARKLMDELFVSAYSEGKITAVDTEFVPISHEPVLMSFSWGRGIRRVVRAELVKDFFGDWLTDKQTKLAWQNYKEDCETMEALGISGAELARSFYIDVMVAGVLRDETLVKHGLKAQMHHFLKWYRREYGQLFCYVPPGMKKPIVMDPRQVMDNLPPDALLGAVAKWKSGKGAIHETCERTRKEWIQLMLDYAGDDAEGTQILAIEHRQFLRKIDYWNGYVTIDLPFTLTLMECEEHGVFLDQPNLRKILRKQEIRIMRAEHCFREAAGNPTLNLRSGPQMSKLLFDEWGWPEHPSVTTPGGGRSMDREVLLWWLKEHKLGMSEVKLAFNNASTMKGTFLTGLLEGVSEDGRLRSDINQIGAKKCMPAGELVLTSRGYLPVEGVRVGDLVIGHSGLQRRVVQTVDNGVHPIVRVTLADGLMLRTVLNHEYRVRLKDRWGWKEARHLKVEDEVQTHSRSERWKTIAWCDDFEVSSWGRVRNRRTGRVLQVQVKDKYGHLKISLHRNGAQERGVDRRDFAVHRLVQEAFGSGPVRPEVRHRDGIAWNNTAVNLVWGTRAENAADTRKHGTAALNLSVKLTQEDVDFIRSTLHVRGGRGRRSSDAALAEMFGVTRSNISAVRLGRSWNVDPGGVPRTEFYSSRVKSVVLDGCEQTFGLVVEEDHSHVTGGIVTHNTGRVSSRKMEILVEKHKELKSGEIRTTIHKKKVGANLQNIPARKEKDPDGIRSAFRAPRIGETTAWGRPAEEEHSLLVSDYSGFELVMVIHWVSKLTKTSAMLNVMEKYKTPSAVHVYSTINLFADTVHRCSPACIDKKTNEYKKCHKPGLVQKLGELTMDDWKMVKPLFPDQYSYGKNSNFGLVYLGSPWTLAYNTGRDANDPDQLQECKDLYDAWYELYPEITIYQNHMIDHGYEHGWVPTLSGRRGNVRHYLDGLDANGRYIEDEKKRENMIKHGERVCTNTPSQGSAADIVKVAMNLLRKSKLLRDLRAALLFPVHDEVLMEAPRRNAEQALAEQIRIMKLPFVNELGVPLEVEGAFGPSWTEAKP